MDNGISTYLFILNGIVVGLAVGTGFLLKVKRVKLEFEVNEYVHEDFLRSFSKAKTWKEMLAKLKNIILLVKEECSVLFRQTLIALLPIIVIALAVEYYYFGHIFVALIVKLSLLGSLIVTWRSTLNFFRILPKQVLATFSLSKLKNSVIKCALFGSMNLILYATSVLSLFVTATVWAFNRMELPDTYTTSEYSQAFNILLAFCLASGILTFGYKTTSMLYSASSLISSSLISSIKFSLEPDDSRDPVAISKLTGKVFSDISFSISKYYFTLATLTFSGLSLFSSSPQLAQSSLSMYFPLLLYPFSILILIPTFCVVFLPFTLKKKMSIVLSLKIFSLVYTLSVCGFLLLFCQYTLPEYFEFIKDGQVFLVKNKVAWACIVAGNLLGLLFGLVIENASYANNLKVVEVIESCKMGEGTGVILGLAFGYRGCIGTFIMFSIVVSWGYYLGGPFGVWFLAAGSCLNLPLAYLYQFINTFLNSGKTLISLMHFSGLITQKIESILRITEKSGNFAEGLKIIGNYLVSFTVFSIFISFRVEKGLNLLDPLVFCGIFLGSMIPYSFSAVNTLMVLIKVEKLSNELRKQCSNIERTQDFIPDYLKFQEKAKSSLKKFTFMLCFLTCFLFFVIKSIFGQTFVSALFIGVLISSFLIEMFSLNSSFVWAECKTWFEWFVDPLEFSGKTVGVSVDTIGKTLRNSFGETVGILTLLISVLLTLP